MTRLKLLAAVAAAAALLLPSAGRAGAFYGTYPTYCSKNADGSGSCQGSPFSYRTNADPSAYVWMVGWSNPGSPPTAFFIVYLNGVYYSCFAADPAIAQGLSALTSHANPFGVSWNASGSCTFVASYSISYNQ